MDQRSLSLFVPRGDATYFELPLGVNILGGKGWADRALATIIAANPATLLEYVGAWSTMWGLYLNRTKANPAYWFTGACGRPASVGEGWPIDADSRPIGSISDGKTSVGMDRTDDIKKSTFQVLNLGVKLRQETIDPWTLTIGLASNLHAGRHHDEYLLQYEDIVWGWLKEEDNAAPRLYNLFDGIISFSRSHTRDAWIRQIVNWH